MSNNNIVIKCPSCSKLNSVGREHIDKHARCGSCQTVFLVRDDSNLSSQARSATAPVRTSAPTRPTVPNSGGYRPVPSANLSPSSSSPGSKPAQLDTTSSSFTPGAPAQFPQISTGYTTYGGRPGNAACPYCRTQSGVYSRSEISTAGWIVFAVMIISCWPLFWIGLLIKEDKVHCAGCHARLS